MSWTPYAVVSFYGAFIASDDIAPIAGTIPAYFAKSSMVWSTLFYVFTNRKMKSKTLATEDRNKNNEIIELKKKINAEKEQHLQEVQLLKNEIYNFSNKITEKNNHIRNLNEKKKFIESVMKEKDEN